ncbi:MAG: hypothetical protein LAT58_02835 [Opitutales bacterium]|nr:hypothetical protein [Opitutales bacterium]
MKFLLLPLSLLLLTGSLLAQSVTVDPDTPDGMPNSLRDVLNQMWGGYLEADTILIPNGATITLEHYNGHYGPSITPTDNELGMELDQPLTIRTVDPHGEKATIRSTEPFRHFFLLAGELTLVNLRFEDGFTQNSGWGTDAAWGGSIFADANTTLHVVRCVFANNIARGRNGMDEVKNLEDQKGNPAHGGAIASLGEVHVTDSLFLGNIAHGGRGGKGSNDSMNPGGVSQQSYPGGRGGHARGGAIHVQGGSLALERTTFGAFEANGNAVFGGTGGTGGNEGFEGLPGFHVTITSGNGGSGGDAWGGAVYIGADAEVETLNSTFVENMAVLGDPGAPGEHGDHPGNPGYPGSAWGGAVAARGEEHSFLFTTIYRNQATNNGGGFHRYGGELHLRNTVITDNEISVGSVADFHNADGAIQTFSHNFVQNTEGFNEPDGAEGNVLGSGDHGMVEELQIYDGAHVPTVVRTSAGGLANAGDPSEIGYPVTDARNLPRVFNGRADIGATELHTHTLSIDGPFTISLGEAFQTEPTVTPLIDGTLMSGAFYLDVLEDGDEVGPFGVHEGVGPISWSQLESMGVSNRETVPIRIRAEVGGVSQQSSSTLTIQNTAPHWADSSNVFLGSAEKQMDPPGQWMEMVLINDQGFHYTEPVSVAVSGVNAEHLQYRLEHDSEWLPLSQNISEENALLLAPESRIRLQPPDEFFNGEFHEAVELRLWETTQDLSPGDQVDMSDNGGSTPFSGDVRMMDIIVYPVNDAPEATEDTVDMPDMYEKESGPENVTVESLFAPVFFDVDGDDFSGVAVRDLSSGGVEGTWRYRLPGESQWRSIGFFSDQYALLLPPETRIRFSHGGGTDYGQAPPLSVRLFDGSTAVDTAPDFLDLSELIGGQGPFSEDTVELRQTVIGVIDDAPTALLLDNSSVEESTPGALVGTLSTEDPDNELGDTHTYSIVDDLSGLFVIANDNELRVHPDRAADYEIRDSHTLTIRTTDSVGLYLDETFTIQVQNRNDPPAFLTQALLFDGSNEVSLPGNQVTNSFTLEAWIRVDEYRDWARIIRFSNGQANDNLILSFDSTGRRLMLQTFRDGTSTTVSSEIDVPLNRWVHVAGVNHGSGTHTAAVYINGIRVGFAGNQHAAAGVHRSNNALASSTFNNPRFKGVIGQARLWDTWVDQDGVIARMNTPGDAGDLGTPRFQLFDENGELNGTPSGDPERIGIRDIVPMEEGFIELTGLDFYDPEATPDDLLKLTVHTTQGVLGAFGGGQINVNGNGSDQLVVHGARNTLRTLLTSGNLQWHPPENTLPDTTISLELNDQGHHGPGGEQIGHASFTIRNPDLPLPPYDLQLSSQSVPEMHPGAVVGSFTVSDPHPDTTHTFTLLAQSQDVFEIQDDLLRLQEGMFLTYAESSSHEILVSVENNLGYSSEAEFVIQVLEQNTRPEWTTDGFTHTLEAIPQSAADPAYQSVANALEAHYYDADEDPFLYYALTGNAASAAQGTWQLSDGTPVPTDLSDDNTLIVPKDLGLRFVPNPQFTGTPGGLTVRAWDGSTLGDGESLTSPTPGSATGNMGLTGPYSAETGTIAIDEITVSIFAPVYTPLTGRAPIWTLDPGNPNEGWHIGYSWFYDQPQGVAGDPETGFLGDKVYGHGLTHPVTGSAWHYLRTPELDVQGYTNLELSYKRWLQVRPEIESKAHIRLSLDETPVLQSPTTTIAWEAEEEILDESWTDITHDLEPARAATDTDDTLYVSWYGGNVIDGGVYHHISDGGWNLDHIRLTADNAQLPESLEPFLEDLLSAQGVRVGDLVAHAAERISADDQIPLEDLGLAFVKMRQGVGNWQVQIEGQGLWTSFLSELTYENALPLGPEIRIRLANPRPYIIHDLLRAHLWDGREGNEGEFIDITEKTGPFESFSEDPILFEYNSFEADLPPLNPRPLNVSVPRLGTGLTVGTLAADEMSRKALTFTLLDDPLGKFEIVGDQLRLKPDVSLSIEDPDEVLLNIRYSSESGLYTDSTVTVNVLPLSTQPLAGFGHFVTLFSEHQQYLRVDGGFPLGQSFSIELWVRNNDFGKDQPLLSQGYGVPNGLLHLILQPNGSVRFGFWGNDLVSPPEIVPNDVWTHLAFTYDHATGERIIYRNGRHIASDISPDSLIIGGLSMLIGYYFESYANLDLDEIRVWDYARDADDIAEHFQRRVPPGTNGLLALYDFEINVDNHSFDRSGQERHAEMFNFEGIPSISIQNMPLHRSLTSLDSPTLIPVTGLSLSNHELSFILVQEPSHGTAEIVGDNIHYTPDLPITEATDSFFYQVFANGVGSMMAIPVVVELIPPPEDLTLDPSDLLEYWPGAPVGQLNAVDPFDGDITFEIIGHRANQFTIDDGMLRLRPDTSLAHADAESVSVPVRASTTDGGERDETFDISVLSRDLSPRTDFGIAGHFPESGGPRLRVDDSLTLHGRSFTVEFWARDLDPGNHTPVLSQGQGSPNQGLHLTLRTDATRLGFFSNDLDAPTMPAHEWHHYAFSFDHETRARQIHINGELAAEDTSPQHPNFSGPVYIARFLQAHGHLDLDELRIWEGVRSTSEIAEHQNRRVPADHPDLLLLVDFEHIHGDFTADRSSAGRLVHLENIDAGTLAQSDGPTPRWQIETPGALELPLNGFSPSGDDITFIEPATTTGSVEINGNTLTFDAGTVLTTDHAEITYQAEANGLSAAQPGRHDIELPYLEPEFDPAPLPEGLPGALAGTLTPEPDTTYTLYNDTNELFEIEGDQLRLKPLLQGGRHFLVDTNVELRAEAPNGFISARSLDLSFEANNLPPVFLTPAFHFNSGNDEIDLPAIPAVVNSYTIEAWVKLDQYVPWSRIIRFSNGQANDNLILGFESSGKRLMLETYNDGGSRVESDIEIPLGQWVHVAGVNYGSATGTAALYVNGIRVGFADGQNNAANVPRADNAIASSTFSAGSLRGTVGQARLFNTWLPQEDIIALRDNFHTPAHLDNHNKIFELFQPDYSFTGTPFDNPTLVGTRPFVGETRDPLALDRLRYSDPDSGPDDTLRLTASVPTGTLTASGDGLGISGNETDTVVIEGSGADLAAFLHNGGLAYHLPGYGGVQTTVTLVIDDLGNSGPGGPQSGTADIPLTVDPPDIAVLVQANDETREAGAPNPDFTFTITGLPEGETFAGLFGEIPSAATEAGMQSPPGNYPITVALGELAADGFQLEAEPGTLTIVEPTVFSNWSQYHHGEEMDPAQPINRFGHPALIVFATGLDDEALEDEPLVSFELAYREEGLIAFDVHYYRLPGDRAVDIVVEGSEDLETWIPAQSAPTIQPVEGTDLEKVTQNIFFPDTPQPRHFFRLRAVKD